tara:strand:+ start:688 stop:885 length:198 start_codon:yes stop_codon:yes gene_type:complete
LRGFLDLKISSIWFKIHIEGVPVAQLVRALLLCGFILRKAKVLGSSPSRNINFFPIFQNYIFGEL